MIDSSRCPPEQVVVDYAAGRLSAEDAQSFELHLQQCLKCMEAMEWVRFHFFREGGETDLSSVAETRSLSLNGEQEVVTAQLNTERFDMSLLTPTANPSALGRLGQYEVLQLIGYGGMGVVFKAYDERLRRTVAIKALNRSLATSATARRRFIREARAAAAINHPHVVIIYQVEDHQDQPFLVMEYIGGGTLRDRLRKEGRLDPIPVLRITAQIAAALHAAHRQGIVHRDVKPANIMLEDGLERVKIADFGLARVSVDNVELTTHEMAVGTPAYMAPEQVRGEKIDGRADLFALGCVMYAMLTGHSPFHAKSALEMSRKVLDVEPPPPDEVRDDAPPFLSEIVMRLLEKDPAGRFQSAGELAETLNAHLAVINQTPTDQLSAVLQGRPVTRKKAPSLKATLGVVLAVAALGALLIWSSSRPDKQALAPAIKTFVSPVTSTKPVARITVAKSVPADCSLLNEALERAGNGTIIEILDGETYEESLVINRPEQWSGIQLIGHPDHPPTFTSDYQGILTIWNTPGVVVRNVHVKTKTATQHAIVVRGKVPGLLLENLHVTTDLENEWALVHITDRASGSLESPARIRHCRFQAHDMAVTVNGDASVPVSHWEFTDNHFSRGKHLQFNRCIQTIRVSGNVFEKGTGIALGLGAHQNCKQLTVTNNTFLACDPWLHLRDTPPDTEEVLFANNLILESVGRPRTGRFSLSEYADNWSFRCNHSEQAADLNDSELQRITQLQPKIDVRSRDVTDVAGFLRLPADSPLAKAGAGNGLPSYVGAFRPEEM